MSITTSSLLPEPAERQHLEDNLQRQVVSFLRWALPDDACFTHIPLGGQRHKRAAQRLVGLGTKAGWPDLLIVYRSKAYFIELKAPHGVLSAVQRQAIRKLIYCGAVVLVCRSLEDVEAGLREASVPLRASVS